MVKSARPRFRVGDSVRSKSLPQFRTGRIDEVRGPFGIDGAMLYLVRFEHEFGDDVWPLDEPDLDAAQPADGRPDAVAVG